MFCKVTLTSTISYAHWSNQCNDSKGKSCVPGISEIHVSLLDQDTCVTARLYEARVVKKFSLFGRFRPKRVRQLIAP